MISTKYSMFINTNPNIQDCCAKIRMALEKEIDLIFQRTNFNHQADDKINLTDTKNSLRESLKGIKLNEKSFFKEEGQCAGISEWFIALYLNFKKKYPGISLPVLLKEITKEFSDGAGIQAAFLQKYQTNSEVHKTLLQALQINMEERQVIGNETVVPTCLENIEDKKIEDILSHEISTLPDGIYGLNFGSVRWPIPIIANVLEEEQQTDFGHATVLIIEQGYLYFFDPNFGLIDSLRLKVGREVAVVLSLCKQYFPKSRTRDLLEQGIKEVETRLNSQQNEILKLCAEHFMERAHASAWELTYLMNHAIGKTYEFTEEQRQLVLDRLCYKPADLQFALRQNSSVNIKKYSIVN